jgi:two-component system sensor histidine kinase KdpD
MNSGRVPYFRQVVLETAAGAAGVAAITGVAFVLRLDFAITACLYLLVIVIGSTFANFASCAAVSIIAIVSLDYFFVPPYFTFRISRPVDGLALLTLLVTALVITRLASREREAAQKAEARRRDMARLYELASRLIALSPVVAARREYLSIFREVFDLRSVCLFDGDTAAISCDGRPAEELGELARQAYVSGRDMDDQKAQIAVRCLRAAGKPIGAAGFQGLRDPESLAGPLAVLAAAMVQRAHFFETASRAAAATQIEVLRTAILDAFAHQFKTPLAAILTAAGSLRETGPLVWAQEEMVETIESQAAGLGRLTTRLLRMARLDRDEITPTMELTDLGKVVSRIAGQYRNSAGEQVLVLRMPDEPVHVPSDPEMLSLAIAQLLDNAFRYSPPASTITVTASSEGSVALIQVTNQGAPIPPEEQSRIFDRFYRGSAGNQRSGTGLGLYVARKIVLAHGGTLELDQDHIYSPDTTFCLRLPISKDESEHELKPDYSFGGRQ